MVVEHHRNREKKCFMGEVGLNVDLEKYEEFNEGKDQLKEKRALYENSQLPRKWEGAASHILNC